MKPYRFLPFTPLVVLTWQVSFFALRAELTEGLVSYWPLDAIEDGRAVDLVGGMDMDAINLSDADVVPGKVGNAVSFSASRMTLLERIHAEGDPLPANQYEALTVSFWALVAGTGQTDLRMFSEASDTGDRDPLFNIGTASDGASATVDLYIRASPATTLNHVKTVAAPLDGENWHHIVWAQDGPNAVMYIDGVADSTDFNNVSPTDRFTAGKELNTTSIGGIRRNDRSHHVTGLIDDVAVWSRALTADEVIDLYDNGLAVVQDDPNLSIRAGDLFADIDSSGGPFIREVSISNFGATQTLVITDVSVTGDAAELFSVGDYPSELAPGERGVIPVTLDPGDTVGGLIAYLEVNSNDQSHPIMTVEISAGIPSANQLVGHYKMDETSGETMLDSALVKHGEYVRAGDGDYSLGQSPLAMGTSVEFASSSATDGAYGQALLDNDIPLTAFTVSLWFNQSAQGIQTLFAKGDVGSSTPLFAALTSESQIWWLTEANSDAPDMIDAGLEAGQTYHAVFVYTNTTPEDNTADNLTIYLNGAEIANIDEPSFTLDDVTQPLLLGSFYGTLGFTGQMDDVQIYKKALTAEDALFLFENPGLVLGADPNVDSDGDGISDADELAQGTDPENPDSDADGLRDGDEAVAGTDPLNPDSDNDGFRDGKETALGYDPNSADDPGDGLDPAFVAYWKLDEVQGSTTPDSLGLYPLMLVNLSEANLIAGQKDMGLAFDGANNTIAEYIAQPGDELPINLNPARTISLWVKAKGEGQTDLRFFSEAWTQDTGPLFNMGTHNEALDDTVDMYIRGPGNHEHSVAAPLDDTWHHLVWVSAADGTGTLYVDGVADAFGPWSNAQFPNLNTTSLGGIRRATASHMFTGALDDVALWSRALTAGEVARLAAGEDPFSILPDSGPPPNDDFYIVSFDLTSPVQASITFTSTPEVNYEIHRGTNLMDFVRLANATGANGATTTTVQVATGGFPEVYYRVVEP